MVSSYLIAQQSSTDCLQPRDRVEEMQTLRKGEYDLDNLCKELMRKARCSEKVPADHKEGTECNASQ